MYPIHPHNTPHTTTLPSYTTLHKYYTTWYKTFTVFDNIHLYKYFIIMGQHHHIYLTYLCRKCVLCIPRHTDGVFCVIQQKHLTLFKLLYNEIWEVVPRQRLYYFPLIKNGFCELKKSQLYNHLIRKFIK